MLPVSLAIVSRLWVLLLFSPSNGASSVGMAASGMLWWSKKGEG